MLKGSGSSKLVPPVKGKSLKRQKKKASKSRMKDVLEIKRHPSKIESIDILKVKPQKNFKDKFLSV